MSYEAFDLLCISHEEGELEPRVFPGAGAGNSTASVATSPMFLPSASGVDFRPRRARAFRIFLNNALDVLPRPPLAISIGEWILHYQFYAIDFPILQVEILLRLTDSGAIGVEVVSQGLSPAE